MKIAVTYDNGNIFQHFGKTENFKVYEVEDNQVVSSEVIGSNGTGHGALAGLLSEQGVDVLICGGIGGGAQAALAEAGVELCSGAEGDVDAAVERSHLRVQPAITTITRKAIPAAATAEAMRKRRAPAAVPAEPAAADAVHRLRLWKVRMSEKPAVPTTEEPSTMEPSLILPTTAANRSSSSAVWAR